jgi:hypothetical protein
MPSPRSVVYFLVANQKEAVAQMYHMETEVLMLRRLH